jgi:signal transduction histidine kinase/DNA-binding response OmpR family regulator
MFSIRNVHLTLKAFLTFVPSLVRSLAFSESRYSFLLKVSMLATMLFISNFALASAMEILPYRDNAAIVMGDTNITARVDFLLDERNTFNITDVQRANINWQENRRDILDLGYKDHPVWLRIPVSFGELQKEDWFLRLGTGLLRDVEVYFISDGSVIQEYPLNQVNSFDEKPYNHSQFIFPFHAQSEKNVTVYVRIYHSTQILFPVYLETDSTLAKNSQDLSFLFGAFAGLIAVLALYNLFVYFATKDLAYLFYVSYIISIGFYFISLNGIGFQFFWSSFPLLDQYLLFVPINSVVLFSCLFIVEFLNLRKLSKYLVLYFYGLAGFAFLFCLPLLNQNFELAAKLNASLTTLAFMSFIVVGIYCWRKQAAAYAFYYVLAWIVFSITVIIASLAFLGLAPYDLRYANAAQFGSAVEAVLISFALGARINLLREESYKAQAENKAKSNFIAKMSHEIRTPMTGILGMSELLAERLEDATNKHYNNVIHQSGQTLLKIINDILDYSKIEAGNMEIRKSPFDLEKLVLETIDLYKVRALERSLELIADVDSNLPALVKGDEQRIKQVLSNLLSNAVKFTPEGQIILKVLVLDATSGFVKISVIDSGEGIDVAYQQVLFDAFSQEEKASNAISRQSGGVGLGVTISKQLVEMMGGTIGFSSRKGLGSTFWFKLNLEPCEGKFLNKREFSQRELDGKRILVVDDNFTFCELLKIQVERWGMDVYIAHNGEQALNMLLQSDKANISFDLVSIDLYMPVMDGLQLGEQMNEHESLRNIPRVLLTSIANLPSRNQLVNAGISIAVEKPCAASGLYEAFVNTITIDDDDQSSAVVGKVNKKRESLRLLLVEDDHVNQMVLKGILQQLGHKVEVLSNGQEVLDKVQADDRSFDMILMDCEMPVMDGYEATRRIRQWERKNQMLPVVIIALTAHLLEDQRDICLNAGMDNCIDKPLDAKKLNELVRSYMF